MDSRHCAETLCSLCDLWHKSQKPILLVLLKFSLRQTFLSLNRNHWENLITFINLMKVSLAFLKYSYFYVREKKVKHFLCWKKFQFSGLGSNHPIPTLIEVLTQTANNQNAFFQNMLSAYISYVIYLLLHYARLIFVQVIPWQSYQLQPQNRVQRDTEEEIKVYSTQIGTITRQSPASILFLSYLKNIKQMQQVRLFISHLQIIWRLT